MSSKKSVSSFSYIPSLELRAAISNSKTASLAFSSRDRNTMRACCSFLTHVFISQICISFFHVLYLLVSQTVGKMYFKAIVPFNSVINVNLKIIEHNINSKTQQLRIYGKRIFNSPPLTTTVFTIMAVPQLPVRSCFTAWRVFKEDYSIGLTEALYFDLYLLTSFNFRLYFTNPNSFCS